MEFKKREAKKIFRPRQVKRPSRIGPNFGDLEEKIQNELNPQNNNVVGGMNSIPNLRDTPDLKKVFIVSFNCEMFELGEFNKIDIMCPESSIDKTYDMNTGTRKYIYLLDDNGDQLVIEKILNHWKSLLESKNKKHRFSIHNRMNIHKEKATTIDEL